MPDPSTSTAVSTPRPGIGVIAVSGQITGQSESALMEAYQTAAGGGATTVVLDFTGLEYMNSSGIGLLVTLLIRTQRAKQRLAAAGLTDHYREIFQLTRLDEAITIYESVGDAVSAAGGPS
jgi:anti-sigma B factor antagonist